LPGAQPLPIEFHSVKTQPFAETEYALAEAGYLLALVSATSLWAQQEWTATLPRQLAGARDEGPHFHSRNRVPGIAGERSFGA
jgi:hypothetical protein